MQEEEWQLNVRTKTRRINLNNLINIDSNDFKKRNIVINEEYRQSKYNNILTSNFRFINFEENSHYGNFSESEYQFIIENSKQRHFNLNNFSKISYNNDIENNNINIQKMTLDKWGVETSFRIKNTNTKKILNIFVYSRFDEKNNVQLYSILSYYEINNCFLMILTSYVELLLYIYKIEIEMGKNPKLSKIINKYPYDFKNLNINDIKNYFNNLPKVWLNN